MRAVIKMRHPYQFVEELEFVDLELEVTTERVHAFCEIVSHETVEL